MISPTRRALGRWLEPFAASLWILFMLWTVLVALVWTLGIGEAEVLAWTQRHFRLPLPDTGAPPSSTLQWVLVTFLRYLDPVWVILAAANVHAHTARREGLDVARRWAGILLVAVIFIAWISATTHWPLGPIRYTDRLGPPMPNLLHWMQFPERPLEWTGLRMGPVPLGLPLLWLTVILGARDLALRLRPALSQLQLALGVGVLGLFFEIALESVASKMRFFWLWPPGSLTAPLRAPAQSYLTWFGVSAALAWFLREKRLATLAPPATRSPASVFVLVLAVLLLANAVVAIA